MDYIAYHHKHGYMGTSATMSSSWSGNEVRSLIVPSGESIPEDLMDLSESSTVFAQKMYRNTTKIGNNVETKLRILESTTISSKSSTASLDIGCGRY